MGSLLLNILVAINSARGTAAAAVGSHGLAMTGMVWPAPLAQIKAGPLTHEGGVWLLTGLGVLMFLLLLLVAATSLLRNWRDLNRKEPVPQPFSVEIKKEFVMRTDFDATVDKLESHVDAKVAEMRESNHRLANKFQDIVNNFQEREDGLLQRIDRQTQEVSSLGQRLEDKRSASVGNLHEQLKRTDTELASVKKEAEIHTHQLSQVDQKLTNILQLLPRKVDRS